MDMFRESLYIMHLSFTILFFWLGWLCGLAFGQIGEAFTGSANFPDIGITCIANIAAFIRFLLRVKLWVKFAASGRMHGGISREWAILKYITGVVCGVSTCAEELQKCSVIILKNLTPLHPSERTYTGLIMRYMSNVSNVHSISLGYLPFVETCSENHEGRCGCIVFNTIEEITKMLAGRIPGTLKRLPNSRCLLPSLQCLRNGCHGCNQGLLHLENDILTEGEPQVGSPAAVCELLDLESIHKVPTGICIPVRSANDDDWTNELITVFKPDDKEFRGTVVRKGRTDASSALTNYKNGNGECDAVEKYNLASLFAVPWLTEALINLLLTFFLKVDGFSSAVFASTAVKGFHPSKTCDKFKIYPHWVLTEVHVKSNANNTNICQVLFLRGGFPSWLISGYSTYFVRCICCISWMVLVALEGGANKWYHTHSMPPSKPRILVMLVGICTALVMDALDLKLYLKIRRKRSFRGKHCTKITIVICAIMVIEIVCIVACSAIAGVMGIKVFGMWIYSTLQFLVLVKWFVGGYLLSQLHLDLKGPDSRQDEPNWWYGSCGLYIQGSAFLLNAALAGARAKWEF